MDPARVAWHAAGCPGVPASGRDGPGRCARCAAATEVLIPVREVVSRSFTGVDDWAVPASTGLCPGCAWAYRGTGLRAGPLQVTRDPPGLTALSRSRLAAALAAPVGVDRALAVPTRAGRRHVLPLARWGQVVLDDTLLSWGEGDPARLSLVLWLRRQGVPAGGFTGQVPPWTVIGAATPRRRTEILTAWGHLAPWRRARPWLTLALTASGAPR